MKKTIFTLIATMVVLTASAQTQERMEKKDSTSSQIVVNLYYTGKNGNARKFVEEMESCGTAKAIREEKGNLRYECFFPAADAETVLLIDSWENQAAIDAHHASTMMQTISRLREKYDLTMRVERYVREDGIPEQDKQFIRTASTPVESMKATGIGGIMFKSRDPKATRKWYEDNLGIKDDPYGYKFEWIEKGRAGKTGVTVWSPMPESTDYLGHAAQQFMINYRVENLDRLADQLHKSDVTLLDQIERYEGLGKFLHILGIDGRRVELWEPDENLLISVKQHSCFWQSWIHLSRMNA